MSVDQKDDDASEPDSVIPFPHSRVAPVQSVEPSEPPVYGTLAQQLGIPESRPPGIGAAIAARFGTAICLRSPARRGQPAGLKQSSPHRQYRALTHVKKCKVCC